MSQKNVDGVFTVMPAYSCRAGAGRMRRAPPRGRGQAVGRKAIIK